MNDVLTYAAGKLFSEKACLTPLRDFWVSRASSFKDMINDIVQGKNLNTAVVCGNYVFTGQDIYNAINSLTYYDDDYLIPETAYDIASWWYTASPDGVALNGNPRYLYGILTLLASTLGFDGEDFTDVDGWQHFIFEVLGVDPNDFYDKANQTPDILWPGVAQELSDYESYYDVGDTEYDIDMWYQTLAKVVGYIYGYITGEPSGPVLYRGLASGLNDICDFIIDHKDQVIRMADNNGVFSFVSVDFMTDRVHDVISYNDTLSEMITSVVDSNTDALNLLYNKLNNSTAELSQSSQQLVAMLSSTLGSDASPMEKIRQVLAAVSNTVADEEEPTSLFSDVTAEYTGISPNQTIMNEQTRIYNLVCDAVQNWDYAEFTAEMVSFARKAGNALLNAVEPIKNGIVKGWNWISNKAQKYTVNTWVNPIDVTFIEDAEDQSFDTGYYLTSVDGTMTRYAALYAKLAEHPYEYMLILVPGAAHYLRADTELHKINCYTKKQVYDYQAIKKFFSVLGQQGPSQTQIDQAYSNILEGYQLSTPETTAQELYFFKSLCYTAVFNFYCEMFFRGTSWLQISNDIALNGLSTGFSAACSMSQSALEALTYVTNTQFLDEVMTSFQRSGLLWDMSTALGSDDYAFAYSWVQSTLKPAWHIMSDDQNFQHAVNVTKVVVITAIVITAVVVATIIGVKLRKAAFISQLKADNMMYGDDWEQKFAKGGITLKDYRRAYRKARLLNKIVNGNNAISLASQLKGVKDVNHDSEIITLIKGV